MNLQIKGAAKRLTLSLLLASGLGGCVYAPPYAAYDTTYAPAYGYSSYPASSYYGGYPYGSPAYVYPPVTLGLGFSYYDRGPRHYGHGRYMAEATIMAAITGVATMAGMAGIITEVTDTGAVTHAAE